MVLINAPLKLRSPYQIKVKEMSFASKGRTLWSMVHNASHCRTRNLHIDSGDPVTDEFLTQILHKKNKLTRTERSGRKYLVFNREAEPVTPLPPMTKNVMNRANRGLFAGRHIRFGNNVPHSKKKTRRSWLPNITHRRLHSGVIGSIVKVMLTHRALRTIRKVGGLDNYVTTTKRKIIKQLGPRGWELREMVLAHRMIQNLKKAGKKVDTTLKRPRKAQKKLTWPSRLLKPRTRKSTPLPKDVKKQKARVKMLARAARAKARKK